jgi:hypothetical protein
VRRRKFADAVRNYFGILMPDGRIARLKQLAMGMKQSVDVASTTTKLLLDFPGNCEAQSIIDSARFVGTKKECVAAATEFVKRCRYVGATINEMEDIDDDITRLGELYEQVSDFNGESYDYINKTCYCTIKTLEKLRLTWSAVDRWTNRNAAAHFGLLFYTASTLGTVEADYFLARRYVGRMASWMCENDHLWDKPALPMTPAEFEQVRAWTEKTLENKPRKITKPSVGDTHYDLFVDASDYGWGYICVRRADGAVITGGGPWTIEERTKFDTRRSTSAEPYALLKALCACIPPRSGRYVTAHTASVDVARAFAVCADEKVRILTDHQPLVYALRAGYSKGFDSNAVVGRIVKTWSNGQLTVAHVPGVNNCADEPSRGQRVDARRIEQAVEQLAEFGVNENEQAVFRHDSDCQNCECAHNELE